VKRALLIGINHYKAVPHLMGSLNDVAAMQQILVTRWGFPPANIRVLTEQAATRAAIIDALRQLVRESGPNDTVVVHFSGHGSQVQDLNGDEEDGLDETLVPWDGRTPGVPDIVDDELDVIFGQLRTRSVLVVLDSCHSGTATRGLDFRPRGIPKDERIDLYRDAVITTRAIVPRFESKLLVMSAVAADQEALDGPIDSDYHGVFTYALSRSLATAPPDASPRQVFDRVGQELARLQAQFGRTSIPDPQLEGPPAAIDAPLLKRGEGASEAPGTGVPRLAWLEVRPLAPGKVTLAQGTLLGAIPGSTWAVYGPGETQFAPGGALAVATITDNAGLDAHASLDPANASVPVGARAVVLMPALPGRRVPVRILTPPGPQRRAIEDLLARTTPDVEVVGPERPARFLIDTQPNALRLLAADGQQVIGTFDTSSERWAGAVARLVSRSAGAAELLALDNPSSQLHVDARVFGREATRDIVLVADTHPAALHVRRAGEPRSAQNSLQLAVTVNADAYLTVVDVDSEGNTNLLFPNTLERQGFLPDGRISANQRVLLPDSLAAGSRAGFFWDYGPPAGMDTLRIFATTDLATANLIRERVRGLHATSSGGTRAVAAQVDGATALQGLQQTLAKAATRGIAIVADAPSGSADSTPVATTVSPAADWAAASVSVSVSE
jgi:hypothetical protein